MDECHLMSGELEGYVWGTRGQRVEVPIVDERDRQTYYGALDLLSKRVLFGAYSAGNTKNTIAYLQYLRVQFPQQRLLLLWDGSSYHRSHELRRRPNPDERGSTHSAVADSLHSVWPNDPRQNPIEEVWLQAKNGV